MILGHVLPMLDAVRRMVQWAERVHGDRVTRVARLTGGLTSTLALVGTAVPAGLDVAHAATNLALAPGPGPAHDLIARYTAVTGRSTGGRISAGA